MTLTNSIETNTYQTQVGYGFSSRRQTLRCLEQYPLNEVASNRMTVTLNTVNVMGETLPPTYTDDPIIGSTIYALSLVEELDDEFMVSGNSRQNVSTPYRPIGATGIPYQYELFVNSNFDVMSTNNFSMVATFKGTPSSVPFWA